MRRWTRSIGCCLLLALCLNVIAAWCCVALTSTCTFDALDTATWRRLHYASTELPAATNADEVWVHGAFAAPGLEIIAIREGSDPCAMRFEHRAGWPFPVLRGEVRYACDGGRRAVGSPTFGSAIGTGGTIDLSMSPLRSTLFGSTAAVMPLRPLVGSLLLGTGLYAAAMIGAILAGRSARRLWNCLRGRCPRCGYPIGASPRCTECGAAIRRA